MVIFATECIKFLNLYIWGHKAIFSFYQLTSLFFPEHVSVLVIKKKKKNGVFSLLACNFISTKHWFFIISCSLLLVQRLYSWFVYQWKNCDFTFAARVYRSVESLLFLGNMKALIIFFWFHIFYPWTLSLVQFILWILFLGSFFKACMFDLLF